MQDDVAEEEKWKNSERICGGFCWVQADGPVAD